MSTDDNAAYVDLDKQNVNFINPCFLRNVYLGKET